MTAVTLVSTTGTAPITFAAEGPGTVRIDLEDGSTQVYDVAAFREVYRQVVTIPGAKQVILDLLHEYGIDDQNQAKRLVRERFTEDDRRAYVAALKVLYGNGALG